MNVINYLINMLLTYIKYFRKSTDRELIWINDYGWECKDGKWICNDIRDTWIY